MMMMIMMIRVMITAVIVQVTLPVFSYLFFYITFLLLPISLPTCSILFYVYFPAYFPLSFPLPEVMVPSWFYISSGTQPHNFFSYCRCQALHSVTPVSLNCNVNEIKLNQHKSCATAEKAEPLSVQCLDILFVSQCLPQHIYLFTVSFFISLHLALQTWLLYIQ